MKKMILFMMTFVINGHFFAQTCGSAAACLARPVNAAVNNFDWFNPPTYQYWGLANNQIFSSVIDNPAQFSTCNSAPNIFKFCSSNTPDLNEADGWRFVQRDFGTATSGTVKPYFIIYNQHTGILRFFVATAPNNVGQVVLISLGFLGNKKTALLEAYKPDDISSALDEFTSSTGTPSVSNNYSVNGIQWHYADFRMTYDPCTCEFDQNINFEAILVNKSDIDANINLIFNANTEGYLRGEAKLAFNSGNKDFFGTLLGSVKDVFEGIAKIAKPEDNSEPYTASTGAVATSKLKLLVKAFPKVAIIGAIAKSIWAVVKPSGEATGTIKFDGQLKQQTSGTLNGTLTGTITTPLPVTSAIVRNTGSATLFGGTAQNPRWRSTMGVYHILNAPTVRVRKIAGREEDWGPELAMPTFISSVYEERWVLDVPNEIKYVLNPAAQVCLNDLEAKLIIEYTDGTSEETPSYPLNCFKTMKYTLSRRIVDSRRINTQTYISSFQVSKIYLHFSGVVQAPTQEVIFGDRYKIKTDYLPLEEFESIMALNAAPYPSVGQVSTTGGCSGFYGAASVTEIQSVCNSNSYQFASGQIIKNPQSETFDTAFKVKKEAVTTFSVLPNPTNENIVNISYHLNKESSTQIELFDYTGKLIKTIANGVDTEGEHQIPLNVNESQNGIYLIVLKVNGEQSTQKLVINR